jgi:hypothetical protein
MSEKHRLLGLLDHVAGGPVSTFLTDPKAPDPVVPSDLHLVRPAPVDADGNVACIRCSKKVPFQSANLAGSDGFLCLTCQVMTTAPASLPIETRVKKRMWPWFVGLGVLAAAIAVYFWIAARAERRERYEAQFPVVASAGDRNVLKAHAPAWKKGRAKLLASLAALDPKTVRANPAATGCALAQDYETPDVVDFANRDSDRAESIRDLVEQARNPMSRPR